MSGWTRKINWNHWMRLKVLALALVSTAVFAGAAPAKPAEIPYLSHGIGVSPSDEKAMAGTTEIGAPGGVTPTNLARAYTPRFEGVAAPVGGRSFELGEAAIGFGLGLLLATGCAVAIVHSRRGVRMAHS